MDEKQPGQALTVWGYVIAVLGVLAAGATWSELDAPNWVLNAREAAGVGGPLLIAGAVLVAAGQIVNALRR